MPKVSVVIPVFNDRSAIEQTMGKLRAQTCCAEDFDVFVIDNGSTDGSIAWLEQQSDLTLIKEHQHLGSPYSCRNRGIEQSCSAVIALLDSTCIPDETWIEKGLAYLDSQPECDLFGGQVLFNYEDKITAGKFYDSVTNVQMESAIRGRQAAKTANLWVRRTVFDRIGMFEESVRSGEDMRWTGFCSEQGLRLDYCETCTVYKYARPTMELLKKQVRVGKGQIRLWREQNKVKPMVLNALKRVFPAKQKNIRKLVAKNKQVECTGNLYFRVYCVAYFSGLATLFGNLLGLFKK
ncbi:glycosyltransferase [Echinimonas agarilytica]|uniref:Glycosyltransferase family 2 protein n=1 Tax=Echinimonas agarilytica TaxID=1215918 RepID=A0AA42B9L1_9GAMM|nr:glycosyltransferase family 2 protein [Echinimonas agarilytica]